MNENRVSEPVFRLKGVSYHYPGGIPALENLSFSIARGEVVALVGANGSGKSTLLKLLDGLAFPAAGEIWAFGQKLSEKNLQAREFVMSFRQKVGLVFQDADAQLFSPTVWEEAIFGPLQLRMAREEVEARARSALEQLGVWHLKDRPPYLLSGGEKKKVSLASVLSLQPEVLLLDEPTNGLDPSSQGKLIDILQEYAGDKTLVFSTQDLDIVEEIASRIIVLGKDHGVVADGRPEEYLDDSEFLLKTNLIHEHSHRHKTLVHRHQHAHEHGHAGED